MIWVPYKSKSKVKAMRWRSENGPFVARAAVVNELRRVGLKNGPYTLLELTLDGKVVWRQTVKSTVDAMQICKKKIESYTIQTKETMDEHAANA